MGNNMAPGSVAIVGAAETTKIGVIPELSNLDLNADAALNAMKDAELKPGDIDGLACGYLDVAEVASYLGIYPNWVDNTVIGGCSWLLHLRRAAAAIDAGHCHTVLIVHGESGRSRIAGPFHNYATPGSLGDQFGLPYPFMGAVSQFTLSTVRYMREFGVTEQQIANVAVIQREWAAHNSRAQKREPMTVADVMASPVVAWPFRRLMCCLVCDGGGAIIVTAADRATDYPSRPVYLLGSGEAIEGPSFGAAAVRDPMRPEFIRVSGQRAFKEARITHKDVDHLMIYDAFAHLPIVALEGLGFCDYGEAAGYIGDRHTAMGGALPLNTNGGGLSYAHTGSYGMLLMQEAIRQLRGTAEAQVPDARVSVCHAWGGFWSACSTIVLANERP